MDNELLENRAGQERCGIWVKSQSQLFSSPSAKREAECDLDLQNFDTDSEFDSVSECGGKKRRLATQLKAEVLNLICEWKDCIYSTDSIDKFIRHVSIHVPELPIKMLDCGQHVYACAWKNCTYENGNSDEILRHVNYHSFHTKLKCIGANNRSRVKLPRCNRETSLADIFDVSRPQFCRWQEHEAECLATFNNFQQFIFHVSQHVESNPRGNKVKGGVKCLWSGCKAQFPSMYKLREHMRCHTKEKIVACPECGAVFASNTKFHDHCRRQIPIEVQGFQCSHCFKFYPTENILREHLRFHIFKYKCSKCDMSCESQASLVKHIRYRHLNARPFPCQLCSHAAKSQQDLDSHMTVHTKGPNFFCNYEGCSYTCKNAYVFDRHIERVHTAEERWYCCHECPCKYRSSYSLTKHLIDGHNLQWPQGHKRFQYIREEDGCYRLQTVRYECIDDDDDDDDEDDEEASESSSGGNQNGSTKGYKIKLAEGAPFYKFNIVEDTPGGDGGSSSSDAGKTMMLQDNNDDGGDMGQDSDGISMPVISNILISIDQMDAYGNIIESKVIETQETTELPPSDEPPLILT